MGQFELSFEHNHIDDLTRYLAFSLLIMLFTILYHILWNFVRFYRAKKAIGKIEDNINTGVPVLEGFDVDLIKKATIPRDFVLKAIVIAFDRIEHLKPANMNLLRFKLALKNLENEIEQRFMRGYMFHTFFVLSMAIGAFHALVRILDLPDIVNFSGSALAGVLADWAVEGASLSIIALINCTLAMLALLLGKNMYKSLYRRIYYCIQFQTENENQLES